MFSCMILTIKWKKGLCGQINLGHLGSTKLNVFTTAGLLRAFDMLMCMETMLRGTDGVCLEHFSKSLTINSFVDRIVCTHFRTVDICSQF